MKKILFPFQLEEDIYKEAFVSAVKFARNMNAELILLNTFEINVDNNITADKYNKLIREKWILAYNEVTKFNHYYLHHFAKIHEELNIKFVHRFLHGKQLETIRNIISNEDIDLIIIPFSKNTEHNKHQFQIIHNDIFDERTTSILAFPNGYEYNPILKIVFATDLKDHFYYEFYLNEILKYAKVFNASIHFIHVNANESNEEHKNTKTYEIISQIVKNNGNHCFKSIKGKEIVSTLQKYSEENDINMLSVVKTEQSVLGELFHKSISDKTIGTSKIPILFMKEKR